MSVELIVGDRVIEPDEDGWYRMDFIRNGPLRLCFRGNPADYPVGRVINDSTVESVSEIDPQDGTAIITLIKSLESV